MKAIDVLVVSRSVISKAEARRLIVQGCLKVNGETITVEEGQSVADLEVPIKAGDAVKVGKREFIWDDGSMIWDQ